MRGRPISSRLATAAAAAAAAVAATTLVSAAPADTGAAAAPPKLVTLFGVHGFSAGAQEVTVGSVDAATGALTWGPLFSTPPTFDSSADANFAVVNGQPAYLIATGNPESQSYELLTVYTNGTSARAPVRVPAADAYNLPFTEHLQRAGEPGLLVALGEGNGKNLSVLLIDAESGRTEVLDADATGDLDFIMGFPPGVSTRLQPGGAGGGAGGVFFFVAVTFDGARDVQNNVLVAFDVAAKRVSNAQMKFGGLVQSVAGWDSKGLVVATLIPSNSSERGSVVLVDPTVQSWAPIKTLFTFPAGTHPFMADAVVLGDTYIAIAQEDSPSFANKLLVGDLTQDPFKPRLVDFAFQDFCPWGAGSFGGLAG